jgi:ribosomal protein L18E
LANRRRQGLSNHVLADRYGSPSTISIKRAVLHQLALNHRNRFRIEVSKDERAKHKGKRILRLPTRS